MPPGQHGQGCGGDLLLVQMGNMFTHGSIDALMWRALSTITLADTSCAARCVIPFGTAVHNAGIVHKALYLHHLSIRPQQLHLHCRICLRRNCTPSTAPC
jgi:hypothetical protein